MRPMYSLKTEKSPSATRAVLDARSAHPGKTLADLYDPDKMPSDLLTAHKALDKAVEDAYGVDFNGDEEKIVAHLFRMYLKATQANRAIVKGLRCWNSG